MGTRLEAGDRPLIEIPAPTPRFGGSLGPHFLEKHEENRGFQVQTGIFCFRYISGSSGRINKLVLSPLWLPPQGLSPLKNGGMRSYVAYPVIWAPEPNLEVIGRSEQTDFYLD